MVGLGPGVVPNANECERRSTLREQGLNCAVAHMSRNASTRGVLRELNANWTAATTECAGFGAVKVTSVALPL